LKQKVPSAAGRRQHSLDFLDGASALQTPSCQSCAFKGLLAALQRRLWIEFSLDCRVLDRGVAFEEWMPSRARGRHELSEWTRATLHLKVPYHPSACLPSKASRLSHPQAILLLTARRAACVDSVLDRTPLRPQQTEPMNRVAQTRLTVLTTAPAATLITCTTSPTNQAGCPKVLGAPFYRHLLGAHTSIKLHSWTRVGQLALYPGLAGRRARNR
jgi:hypothetical protein